MILIDTSLIIAACFEQDSRHADAVCLLKLSAAEDLLITTDIVSETLNFFAKKTNSHLVHKIGIVALREEKFGRVLEPLYSDRLTALSIIKKYADQRLSFVDALSFAVIQRLKIDQIISFDKDFNLLENVTNLAYKHCL